MQISYYGYITVSVFPIVSQMDIACLSLSLSLALSLSLSLSLSLNQSMQAPSDREISRTHIMEIVPYLCFHRFTDGHNLSLSLGKYADLVLQR